MVSFNINHKTKIKITATTLLPKPAFRMQADSKNFIGERNEKNTLRHLTCKKLKISQSNPKLSGGMNGGMP